MAIEYVNRKGQKYYLHAGTTKTGKQKYFLSMQAGEACLEAIPAGFEIYENPNGQVYVRKPPPKLILDEELAVVEREISRFAHLKNSLLDRKLTALTIYVADDDGRRDLLRAIALPFARTNIDELLRQTRTYTALLRFLLVDEEQRLFQTQRYCFRGSIDDWIYIGGSGSLDWLATLYVKHLGQDSFYDLM
jgi:hypothetical protein